MPRLRVYRDSSRTLLRWTDSEFEITPNRIKLRLEGSERVAAWEVRLLGPVLGVYLEQQMHMRALHGSVVALPAGAVAFVGQSHSGKSSLATACVARGATLVTDDLLVLHRAGTGFAVAPAFKAIRMWPEIADRFVGRHEDFPRFHPSAEKRVVPVGTGLFGEVAHQEVPLQCIYRLAPRDSESGEGATIRPLAPSLSAVELVFNSFSPRLVASLGLQAERLESFAELIGKIPVQNVDYDPPIAACLEEVVDTIFADVDKMAPAEPILPVRQS